MVYAPVGNMYSLCSSKLRKPEMELGYTGAEEAGSGQKEYDMLRTSAVLMKYD